MISGYFEISMTLTARIAKILRKSIMPTNYFTRNEYMKMILLIVSLVPEFVFYVEERFIEI